MASAKTQTTKQEGVLTMNDKKETQYHANVEAAEAIPQDQRLVTAIGFNRSAVDKFEVYWLIPKTDEEAKARYDCDLAYLISKGVRGLSTSPAYQDVGFNDDGSLKPEGHQAMQTLADGFKVGRRTTAGPTIKAKAKEFDSLQAEAAEAGLDMATIRAMIAKKKGKK